MDKTRRLRANKTESPGGPQTRGRRLSRSVTASGQRDPTTPLPHQPLFSSRSIHCRCLAPTKHTAHSRERNKHNVFTIPVCCDFLKPTTDKR